MNPRLRALLAALFCMVLSCKTQSATPNERPSHSAVSPQPSSYGNEALRNDVVNDAVFAAFASDNKLDRTPPVTNLLSSARARRIVLAIREAVRAEGPVTEEELAELTKAHWRDVDAGPSVRVAHVVVKTSAAMTAAAAQKVAETLRAAMPAEPVAFDAFDRTVRAQALPPRTYAIEVLPLMTSEGRALEGPEQSFELPFARAAYALKTPGNLSPVTTTVYGAHVMLLLEVRPERRFLAEVRRQMFLEEAVSNRAGRKLRALLGDLKKRDAPTYHEGLDALLQTAVTPPPTPSSK